MLFTYRCNLIQHPAIGKEKEILKTPTRIAVQLMNLTSESIKMKRN